MIFVIDDDEIMAECVANATGEETRIFTDAYMATSAIAEGELPEAIFLDVLLNGPDGFTFLNDLMSYSDTAKIPVILVTSLKMERRDLSSYGVVGLLNKDTMTPEDVRRYVEQYAK